MRRGRRAATIAVGVWAALGAALAPQLAASGGSPTYRATVEKRMTWAYIGLGLLLLGIALSLAGVYYGLSLQASAPVG